jgi:hypothetical protein
LASREAQFRQRVADAQERDHDCAAESQGRFAIDRTKMREPVYVDYPPEQPGVVGRMVRLHLDNFGYSPSELAKPIHANDNLLNEYHDLNAAPWFKE